MPINAPPHTGGTLAIICGRIYGRVSALPSKGASLARDWVSCDQGRVYLWVAQLTTRLRQRDGAITRGPARTDRRGVPEKCRR